MKRNIALLAVLCFAIAGIVGVAAAQDAQVAGAWTLSSPGRGGNMQNSALTLKQDGQKLTGTLAGARGGDAPLTGTITGNNITFSVTRTTQNGEMTIQYTGTVSGDSMKGSLTMGQNSRDWTATKGAPPAAGAGGGGN
ncbi:MAG TPA: hypothetical protein VIY69_07095 [Candidatus Acidoferrales bacterium]